MTPTPSHSGQRLPTGEPAQPESARDALNHQAAVSAAPPLPAAAKPALRIVRILRDRGHAALLAGGCVRDLLRGAEPDDYDIATDAPPDRICALLNPTRKVGAQFGVVLARSLGRWVEVATFRSDGAYIDGRHPSEVTFADARADALRRDFTINGMFLDPLANQVLDYVGGRSDLSARLIRAIGDPHARFSEDHLRLLRAVRFAARLQFAIEPGTRAAIEAHAPKLQRVAPERVLDELERMLAHPTRASACTWMRETGLLDHLWPGATWPEGAGLLLKDLPDSASAELALLVLLAGRSPAELEAVCRALKCSNEQRESIVWLAEHAADLDDPAAPTLAELKRLMASRWFPMLRTLTEVQYTRQPDGVERRARLARRLDAVAPELVAPAPLVTGADLLARKAAQGPQYKRILDTLYSEQLDERLVSREQALKRLEELLDRGG